MFNKLKQVWRGAAIGVVLATGLGFAFLKFEKFPAAAKLVHLSYDLPFLLRPPMEPADVVMVYMDDESYQNLNQSFIQPWDRSFHARLLDRLAADGAQGVVFDIVFSDPGPNPAADEQFAKAIRGFGKVVLAADYVASAYGRDGVAMKTVVPPYDPFNDAAADKGSAETNPDDDLLIRRFVPMDDDDLLSTMSWAMAKLAGAEVTKIEANRNLNGKRWVNYYGPPATLPNVSYYRAILPGDLPAGYFSNKVVFVGARLLTKFAGDRKDEFPNPYSVRTPKNPFMPGVEIQATQFLNLLRGDWLTRLSPRVEMMAIVFAGFIFGMGLTFFRPLVSVCIALFGAAIVALVAYHLFKQERLVFPWMIIVAAQIPIALLWSIVFNSVQLYVQNKLFEKSLEMYLSPKLVKKFAANKDLLKPGAKKGNLTILFSDIASFTSISEGMDSDELAKHMNIYFETAVGKCIHHTDGTIVKYIGDAIFAFWNAPDPQEDHKLRAVEAAVAFRNLPPQHMNGQLLVTRIGLHTGVANVGNFGSTARVDYTALGENINLAARMEGLNKYLGTIVLLTAETHDGIEGKFTTRFLGNFQLKGFEKSVGVFELVGKLEAAEESRTLREAFAAALKLFQEKKLAEAETAFQKILETNPKDGPSKFYIKHLAELKEHPPEDWTGEVELKEK